jgi:polysaccharide export outer membrane protein
MRFGKFPVEGMVMKASCPMKLSSVIVFSFSLLYLSFSLYGQQLQVRPSVVDQTLASVANLPAHKITPNDLIAVSVYDAPELTRTVRVGADGLLDLPLLKEKIRAEGLLPGDLEERIAAALKSEEILVRPIVTVTIVQYNSRNVSVMGAVSKPLTFQVTGATRLLDALAKAEGLTKEAGPDLLLSKAGENGVERMSLKKLISGSDPALNVTLEGGEEIRIPEARKIYVVGNVKKPGAIPVRDNSESTVLKLLAQVEGVAPYAQSRAWIYRTDPETAQRKEIPIELKKILARKAPDVTLQPDDILYIPDNVNKRAALETGRSILTFGSGAISAIIYAGVR